MRMSIHWCTQTSEFTIFPKKKIDIWFTNAWHPLTYSLTKKAFQPTFLLYFFPIIFFFQLDIRIKRGKSWYSFSKAIIMIIIIHLQELIWRHSNKHNKPKSLGKIICFSFGDPTSNIQECGKMIGVFMFIFIFWNKMIGVNEA